MTEEIRAWPPHQYRPRWRMSADRALARHVGVAAFPVNNRRETGEANQRSFPTTAGLFFGHAISSDQIHAASFRGLAQPKADIRLRPTLNRRIPTNPSSDGEGALIATAFVVLTMSKSP